MVVVARVDVLGAIIVRLRSITELTALTGQRISGAKQDAWQLPSQHCVWVDGPKGAPPIGASQGLPLHFQRYDFNCYGSTGYEAMRVYNVLDAALVPYQGLAAAQFTAAGVRVINVVPDAGPIREVEEETGYPLVLVSYIFSYQAAS